jgi:hypothetical protein
MAAVRNTAASGFAVAVVFAGTTGAGAFLNIVDVTRGGAAELHTADTQEQYKPSVSQSPSRTHAVSYNGILGQSTGALCMQSSLDSAPQGAERSACAALAFDLAGTNFSSLCCDIRCASVLALRIRL